MIDTQTERHLTRNVGRVPKPTHMEAYEVKMADNRYYLVVAASWNEAARAAGSPDDQATQMTRLTGEESNMPVLLLASEL